MPASWREIQAFFTPTPAAPSYWCYSCDRFVRVDAGVLCPRCHGGFLEEMNPPSAYLRRRRNADPLHGTDHLRPRRASPFNPRLSAPVPAQVYEVTGAGATSSSFHLYYNDAPWTRPPPLPDSMSDFLMGSGFELLPDQLAQMEAARVGRPCDGHPPASKAAVESMPTVIVAARHVGADSSDCAVCKESFELGTEAREMPCGHMYHQDCILPWLALRNSCPVCRRELPTDAHAHAQELLLSGGSPVGEGPARGSSRMEVSAMAAHGGREGTVPRSDEELPDACFTTCLRALDMPIQPMHGPHPRGRNIMELDRFPPVD